MGNTKNAAEWKYAVYLEKWRLKESGTAQAPTSPWAIPAEWILFPCTIPRAAQLQAVCHLGLFLNRRGYLSKGQEGKAGKNMISFILSKFDSLGWACLEIRTQPASPAGVSSQGACSPLHMHSAVSEQRDSGAIEQPESTVSWLTLPSCPLLWMHYWWWPQSWGTCSLPCAWRHQLWLYWNVTAGSGHPPILAEGRGGEDRHFQTSLSTALYLQQNFPLGLQTTALCFLGLQHPAFSVPSCPLHSRAPTCSVQCYPTWYRDCLSSSLCLQGRRVW